MLPQVGASMTGSPFVCEHGNNGPLDGRTGKYVISKRDGSPMDPEARYLVLRIDGGCERRAAEWAALARYMEALEVVGNFDLAAHLASYFESVVQDPEGIIRPDPPEKCPRGVSWCRPRSGRCRGCEDEFGPVSL